MHLQLFLYTQGAVLTYFVLTAEIFGPGQDHDFSTLSRKSVAVGVVMEVFMKDFQVLPLPLLCSKHRNRSVEEDCKHNDFHSACGSTHPIPKFFVSLSFMLGPVLGVRKILKAWLVIIFIHSLFCPSTKLSLNRSSTGRSEESQ